MRTAGTSAHRLDVDDWRVDGPWTRRPTSRRRQRAWVVVALAACGCGGGTHASGTVGGASFAPREAAYLRVSSVRGLMSRVPTVVISDEVDLCAHLRQGTRPTNSTRATMWLLGNSLGLYAPDAEVPVSPAAGQLPGSRALVEFSVADASCDGGGVGTRALSQRGSVTVHQMVPIQVVNGVLEGRADVSFALDFGALGKLQGQALGDACEPQSPDSPKEFAACP